MGSAATALATRAALLADEGVRMASAGESGALAACLGNSSLMVFHSTVLMQMGASAHHSAMSAALLASLTSSPLPLLLVATGPTLTAETPTTMHG